MPFPAHRIATVVLTLSLLCACGRPPSETDPNPGDAQKLPFDGQPRSSGISPSQSLIPSSTKLPEGTPIPIRLQSALSSASSHAGDSFSAITDEPVVIDGQTLIPRGTAAIGRVLEAKPAASSTGVELGSPGGSSAGSPAENSPGGLLEPGYLRLVLVSLNVDQKTVMIETSSLFTKGGSLDERNAPAGAAPGAAPNTRDKNRDIVLGVDRRLNFRLAQAVDLR
jgi:hypothetical protein